ncbi:MAG: fumarylacetoacetate hydrolase family protein, partial [Candidatus Bathyarchaeota archaeon]|nr:fumarylacetoacetate hydrolase family protein [Candidatus Bathyarchaeota archaeon]
MRIARFVHDGVESYGVLRGEGKIVDLPRLSGRGERSVPSNIDGLVSMGSAAEVLLGELLCRLSDDQEEQVVLKGDDVALRAPVIAPQKIVCLGLNYKDHAEEGGASAPDEPIIFMKPRTAIVGPEEPIVKPSFVTQLDYEVELAIIMGRKGKNIPVSDAEDHIFG